MKAHVAAWVVLVSALASPAAARMYQWVSPASGSMQLSGEPPAWYRSGQEGPRVWVFENGNLIDDTGIALPRPQRDELREAAFEESDQRQRAEALKRLERAARREQRRQEESARQAARRAEEERMRQQVAVGDQAPPEATGQASPGSADDGSLDAASVERLKAIIRSFDRTGG